ncbi:fibropellin-1-like isoform X2 [Actinia tenebrosa]|uniref:Fibropellin-1-like isoform X2 n=1 Tax=Actinia tenebrosa TaxID=6105 RepID=A0A6P8IFV5_ACTTE|nr:fibropellin-1-like isoform X2 [Actinia tenebrosa]
MNDYEGSLFEHGSKNPCLHGGEVQEFPNGTFLCMCPVGFKGKTCRDLLYCHSNPCHNNGTCIEDAHGFKCICPKGFKGCTCEEFTSCEPNPCENDGICIQIDNNFNCACKPGYQGERCKDADPCFINPCLNSGTCTIIRGKANCSCTAHYGGDYCQVEKVCYDNPCHNGATCVENPTRPCICTKGYAGRLCSEHVCHSNPCLNGGACGVVQATAGGDNKWAYSCTCPVFFEGKKCEVPNFCKGDPCKNGGTCVDLYKQNMLSKRWINLMHQHPYYKCICRPGYTSKQCETDICDSCHDHTVCVDHRCVCNSGYTGDGFDCTRIASPCHPNPCSNGATCSIGPDLSYDCKCPKGYCGEHCDLICDMCALKPCMNGGSCYAIGDKRFCVCPPQYTGPDCNIRLPDLCQPNPCMHNFPCKYLKEKHDYFCDCKGKYSGKNCQDCDCPKATIVPGKKTYDSTCDAVGDCICPTIDGVSLTFDAHNGCVEGKTEQLCFPNPCQNGGTCLVKGERQEYCVCKPPYYGDRCQYKFCDVANPCQNYGTCIDIGVRDYKCRCTPQFTGENCTVPVPEPVVETLCSPSPCLYGGTCKERGNGYDCICLSRYTGPNCEVDRCADCDVNADCVDGHCRCRQGYIGTGYVCEIDSECGGIVCPTENQQCISGQCVCIPGTTCITNR